MAVSVPLMALQAIAARQHNGSPGPENRLREMTVMARQQKGAIRIYSLGVLFPYRLGTKKS